MKIITPWNEFLKRNDCNRDKNVYDKKGKIIFYLHVIIMTHTLQILEAHKY